MTVTVTPEAPADDDPAGAPTPPPAVTAAADDRTGSPGDLAGTAVEAAARRNPVARFAVRRIARNQLRAGRPQPRPITLRRRIRQVPANWRVSASE